MAYDFDGTDDGISLGNAAALNPTVFTVAMWINIDDFGTGGANEIWLFGRDDTSSERSFACGSGSTGILRLQINGTNRAEGATSLSTGTTYPVAFTGQSGDWKVYANGVQDGSNSDVVTPNTANVATTIGYRAATDPGNFAGFTDGRIAEVGFWNVVLTAAEIATLAKGYSPLFVRPASLISYLPLVRALVDYKRGVPTLVSAPTAGSAHPRIIMPRGKRPGRLIAPAPPQTLFPAHFAKRSYVALVTQ